MIHNDKDRNKMEKTDSSASRQSIGTRESELLCGSCDEDALRQCRQLISIFDNIDEVIYVADPATHEILYANRTLVKERGNIVGKKCYEALQGFKEPCSFCTNKYIFSGENLNRSYIWEFQNTVNQHWYHCIDKAIRWPDGRLVRYEMAIDITESRLYGKRISRINECLLKFKHNPNENIDSLVALCGELLAADCSLYNRLEGDKLHTLSIWNEPSGYQRSDRAEGHICYDVVTHNAEDIVVVRNLGNTGYAVTDPNVGRYNLQTYVGSPVKLSGERIGVLCALYQRDIEPCEDDKNVLGIIAAAIAVEESRYSIKKSLEHSIEFERLISRLSTVFINLSPAEIDSAINRALEAIGRFSGVDRSYIFSVYDSKTKADNIYEWCLEGVESRMSALKGITDEMMPWFAKKIRNNEVIHIRNIDDMPEEAAREKDFMKREGLKSVIIVPLLYDNDIMGLIGFDSIKIEKVWSENDISLLRTAGSIFASALKHKEADQALRAGEAFLSSIFKSIQDGISVLDEDYNIIRVNSSMEKWYAHNMPLVGKKCYEAYHGRSSPCEICPTRRTIATKEAAYEIVPHTGKNGEAIGWLDLYSFPLVDVGTGKISGAIEYVRDITARKQSDEALRASESKYRAVFENTGSATIIIEDDSTISLANSQFAVLSGYTIKEIEWLKSWKDFVAKEDLAKLERYHQLRIVDPNTAPKRYEFRFVDKIGNIKDIYIVVDMIPGTKKSVASLIDISDRRKNEIEREKLNNDLLRSNEKLKQMALLDPHTGLYNHRYLVEVLEREFYRAKRHAHPISVIMLDLDYFKSINDVYGHAFGDLVLKQLSRQLKQMVREYDIVVRYGGEEFVIISPATDNTQGVTLAHRILDALTLYNFGNDKHTVKLKLSLAVASYPEDHVLKGIELVELTEKILSKAKESGGNRVYSSSDLIKDKGDALIVSKANTEARFLKDKIEKLTKRTNQGLIESVSAFAKTIELKDQCTGEHVERTVRYATDLAKELGLSKGEIELVKRAAMLHDLGKIGISEEILRKRSKLTRKEFEQIKKHPQIGVDIIRPIQFLHSIIPLMLYHHEHWDGRGYPYGLKGDEIPVGARIVALADVYQALTSDRPYRKAYSRTKAIKLIKQNAGSQFDPNIVNVFLNMLKNNK